MRILAGVSLALVSTSALAGCGGEDPANVAGTYTALTTSRDNGCNLSNWVVGAQSSPITVQITQSGAAASADVQALAGAGLDFLVGGHVFTGSVSGRRVDLTIVGTRAMSSGACAYTIDATLLGELTGNSLDGAVVYEARTNGAADCGPLTGCSSHQDFAGSRAPQ